MKKRAWDIRRYLVEIKLGIFFIIALVLFFITIMSIREISFFKGTYTVKVKFNFVEGLKTASPVRFCGVDVGEIGKLEVREENKKPIVYVYAKIERGINIPLGSKFFINSLSLFGEKYLEIMPPVFPSGKYIKEGMLIEGNSSIPLFDVVSSVNNAAIKLQSFVEDSNIKNSLKETLSNINKITDNIIDITARFKNILSAVEKEQGNIGKLLYDDSLYKKTEELLDDLKKHPWKLLYKPRGKSRR